MDIFLVLYVLSMPLYFLDLFNYNLLSYSSMHAPWHIVLLTILLLINRNDELDVFKTEGYMII